MALLSRALLAKALLDKTTRQYADKPMWGSYNYDKDIYPQARLAFPEYDKLYSTNEEFTKYFVRDLNKKDPQLLQKISSGVVTKEDQVLINQFNQMALAEQVTAESQQGEAISSAQTPAGAPVPAMPGMTMRPPSIPRMPFIKLGKTSEQTEATQKTSEPTRRFNLSALRPSASSINTLKTFGSNAQIFAKRNLGKVFDGLKGIGGGLGRGIAGGIGGGLEAAAPSLGRAFRGGLNGIERITRPGGLGGGGGVSSITKVGKGRGKWAFVLMLVGMMFLATLLGALPGSAPPGQAGPLPPGGGDISKCEFTRGNAKPPAEGYQSPALLGYFQQASAVSSVPAAVLAAIARVESPTITSKADADLPYLSSTAGCPRSPTGALGIMQIQPPGTRGYIQAAVNQGASYLGKTAEQLTEADFCDVKSSITIASGFILKKIQLVYGLGDGIKWDPSWINNKDAVYKVAESYYGCLQYGGLDPTKCEGAYNYGDDIWTSIQNCKVQPAPPGGSDFASQLVEKIKKSLKCNGFVNKSNHDECITSIQPPPLPQLSARAIRESVFNVQGGVLQCVGFVKAVVTDLIDQAGHAIAYSIPGNVLGYRFILRQSGDIKVGDLPVWNIPDFGHIAYVVSVQNNGAFVVAEANYCPGGECGRVDLRGDSINDNRIIGWLRKEGT